MVTVRAIERLASEPAGPRSRPCRASSARISATSVRSVSKVFSLPDDFGSCSDTTARSSSPNAIRVSQSAFEPTASRSTAGSAERTSTSLAIPRSLSSLRGHRPDAPERFDGKALEERLDALGRDHGEAVRLLPARGDLREELVRAPRPPRR